VLRIVHTLYRSQYTKTQYRITPAANFARRHAR
jgi:hypothetical protein